MNQQQYQAALTPLNGLQNGRTITYALTEVPQQDTLLYGVQITEVGSSYFKSELIPPFTESRAFAQNLLRLLQENAVPLVHCRAIIDDACTLQDGIGWSDHGEGVGTASYCG